MAKKNEKTGGMEGDMMDEDLFADESHTSSPASEAVEFVPAAKTLRERQQELADAADDQVVHIVYRHAGATFTGAKEVVGRVEDVEVMDEHDVGTRYGPGCFTVHSYFRSNTAPEKRIMWRARVGAQYAPREEAPAPAPAASSGPLGDVSATIALLDQLVGLTQRLQPPAQPSQLDGAMAVLSKGIEGMMSVVATTMRQAVKVQAERMIEPVYADPEPAPAAPAAGDGLNLKDLLEAVGGLPGLMRMFQGAGGGGQQGGDQ